MTRRIGVGPLVAAASTAIHGIGGLGLLLGNRNRIGSQQGMTTNRAWKTALTLTAVRTTASSGSLGAKLATSVHDHGFEPPEGGTVPSRATSSETAASHEQLRVLQWATRS